MEPEFGEGTYPYIIRGSISWRRDVSLLHPWKYKLEAVETEVEGTYPYLIRGNISWKPWKQKLNKGSILT
jgi:hypothetical protein